MESKPLSTARTVYHREANQRKEEALEAKKKKRKEEEINIESTN